MPKKSSRREYHLLITRSAGGFGWEIRYDSHSKPVHWSTGTYPSEDDARRAGQIAMEEFLAGPASD